jgi:hypothetical protein
MKTQQNTIIYIITTIVFFLCFQQTECMKTTKHKVLLKLDDQEKYKIPFHLAIVSNTIHKKQCWKERLAINEAQPIILHDITLDDFYLLKRYLVNFSRNYLKKNKKDSCLLQEKRDSTLRK